MKAKLFALACLVAPAAFGAVSETPEEFHATADVNGDGRPDIVVVDKLTGIYRLAYGQANGTNLWVDGRPSGMENVTGFAAGRVLNVARDALLFTSPSANRVNVFDASAAGQAGQPINVFIDSIGPNRVAALDIGGSGNTAHDDIYTPSADNTASEPYRLSLTRSTGGTFSEVWDTNVTATVVAVDAVRLKTNVANPILAGAIQRTGTNYSFVAQNLSTGLPVNSTIIPVLPPADAYVYANFDGTPLNQFLFHRAGSSNLMLRPVVEVVPGFFQFGPGATFTFNKSLREVLTISGPADVRLVIIFGAGETAGVYSFNGVSAPVLVESFTAVPGESFTGAAAMGNGHFSLFSGANGKSTAFQDWKRAGNGYSKGAGGDLPAVNALSSAANVFLFVNKPFVHPAPRLVGSLNAADWSSRLQTTNPPGQISLFAERYVNSAQGLDNPVSRNLGAAPAGAGYGLPNQIADSFSLLSFSPAVGSEVVEVNISPKPGHYALGVSVAFSKPAGTNALIFYRLAAGEDWKLFLNQAVPLFKDTTIAYYAFAGGKKSTIRTATYTFDKPPAQLDSDGDGVPDFVELGKGGDDAALHSKDSDGDGYSDLAEILAGTGHPPGFNGDPYNASITPTNAPRADELSAFDWAVSPRALAGVVPGLLSCQTGTVVSAFDLHGGLLNTRAATPFFNIAISYYSNLFADVGQRLYLAATEPHFDVRTNNAAFPTNASTRVGRELLRFVPVPELATSLQINYTYGGGTLAQETANWIAAAQAAQAAVVHPVLFSELTHDDTLVSLLCERKMGDLLLARGSMAPTNQITLFPFRPQDAGRFNPPHTSLLALETNLVLNTGEPDPAFPGHRLVDIYKSVSLSVTSPPTAQVVKLRSLAAEIYRISAVSNNVAPGVFPSPVDTLRAFIEGEPLNSNYLAATTFTAADLTSAATGASQVLAAVAQRPTTNLTLRVRADSFAGACVILETLTGGFRSLVLADGTPFKFPVAFQLVPESEVEVFAYTDRPSTCGSPTLEIISLNVSAFPAVSSTDANGNLLADAWECLYLVSNPNGDDDQDGANNLKEFLDGTDPRNALSIGGDDDATPPAVNIEPGQGGQIKLSWQWPPYYAGRMRFALVSTDALGQNFVVENATAQDLGGGSFQMVVPNSGTPAKFFRLQMSLK